MDDAPSNHHRPTQIRAAFHEHTQDIEKKRAELRKLEEGLLKSKKDAEKQATKLKALSGASGANAREAELQNEIDKCMVSDKDVRRAS